MDYSELLKKRRAVRDYEDKEVHLDILMQIINEKRAKESKMTFDTPSYVKLAESAYKLGTCDPSKIDMVKVAM